ncbi:MAG TPA: DUF2946 family protein [Paucimonas sp.]|nr:DUF2946 family protein [Paucimonas sp.]
MDDIVKQAMAKWPNVPHCYGWLALDARGHWRMRDERAQALQLPGDKINHPALLGFINRNYLCDERGRWYFQNGPQRVYVSLDAAPFVARTDPAQGFVLHTGEPMTIVDDVWMTETGQLILEGAGKVAAVDDRDLAQCIAELRIDGRAAADDDLVAWLEDSDDRRQLALRQPSRDIPVRHIASALVAERFGFVRQPRPD